MQKRSRSFSQALRGRSVKSREQYEEEEEEEEEEDVFSQFCFGAGSSRRSKPSSLSQTKGKTRSSSVRSRRQR